MPSVSIIIPSYNTQSFIGDALESVISQSFSDFECLVVDDASTDGSVAIIKKYAKKDSRIIPIFLKTNQGVSQARNLALEQSKGRYIAFLDSDDTWEKDKLKIQIAFMLSRNIAFCHTPYFVIDTQGKKIGSFSPKPIISYQDALKTCDIGNSTAVYDTAILGKVSSGVIRHDYEIWLKILKNQKSYAPPPFQPPCFLASIRIRCGSDTHNKIKSAKRQWQVYREIEKLSLLKSAYYFAHYAFYGLKKRRQYFKGVA
ncbi:glycosyltransferase family 2 protein [Helicobacter sp. 11S02596-1]|uniref:glycosyltransferase family 2 protein n=1 Tax=Helicobacter sp. 11S02596-1 TaxID=1476194 RepID=UPI000BA5D1CC|nr:glycosyltransferase family 2 protein [Helicobacter sp. 11S02596-1]PAF42810.1 hypothetical protein BJI48_06020 [Helicobacter sp. 11S02596-1]